MRVLGWIASSLRPHCRECSSAAFAARRGRAATGRSRGRRSARRSPARSCPPSHAARRPPRAPATPSRRRSYLGLLSSAAECGRPGLAHRAPRRACRPAPGRAPRDRSVPPHATRSRRPRPPSPRSRHWPPAGRRWTAGRPALRRGTAGGARPSNRRQPLTPFQSRQSSTAALGSRPACSASLRAAHFFSHTSRPSGSLMDRRSGSRPRARWCATGSDLVGALAHGSDHGWT